MSFKRIYIIAFPIGVLFACTQALYVPNKGQASNTGQSVDSLLIGRNLYINNCANCHNLYQPKEYSKSEWAGIMPGMQRKAKISKNDAALILRYIEAASAK